MHTEKIKPKVLRAVCDVVGLHRYAHLNLLLPLLGTRDEQESAQGVGWHTELSKALGNTNQIKVQQKWAPLGECTKNGQDEVEVKYFLLQEI